MNHYISTKKITWKIIANVYSLWPGDAIRWYRLRSTLAQVIACCLTPSCNYLHQHWLLISRVRWHSLESNLQQLAKLLFSITVEIILATSPRGQWVTVHQVTLPVWNKDVHNCENVGPFVCKMYSYIGIDIAWMPLFVECTNQVSSWMNKGQKEILAAYYATITMLNMTIWVQNNLWEGWLSAFLYSVHECYTYIFYHFIICHMIISYQVAFVCFLCSMTVKQMECFWQLHPFTTLYLWYVNTIGPRQNGCHFPCDILKYIFLNDNV